MGVTTGGGGRYPIFHVQTRALVDQAPGIVPLPGGRRVHRQQRRLPRRGFGCRKRRVRQGRRGLLEAEVQGAAGARVPIQQAPCHKREREREKKKKKHHANKHVDKERRTKKHHVNKHVQAGGVRFLGHHQNSPKNPTPGVFYILLPGCSCTGLRLSRIENTWVKVGESNFEIRRTSTGVAWGRSKKSGKAGKWGRRGTVLENAGLGANRQVELQKATCAA